MFRPCLCLLFSTVHTAPAIAQNIGPSEVTQPVIILKPFGERKMNPRDEHVRAQLEARQAQFFSRDRKSFRSIDTFQVTSPGNQPQQQKASTKVSVGIMYKF